MKRKQKVEDFRTLIKVTFRHAARVTAEEGRGASSSELRIAKPAKVFGTRSVRLLFFTEASPLQLFLEVSTTKETNVWFWIERELHLNLVCTAFFPFPFPFCFLSFLSVRTGMEEKRLSSHHALRFYSHLRQIKVNL